MDDNNSFSTNTMQNQKSIKKFSDDIMIESDL